MRVLKWLFWALVVLVLVFGIYGFWTVRRSFPTVDGTLEVPGLNDTVEVIRDDFGVPHIYASNSHDLFFAQGYTHAQERFWQMDFWRHIGAARLSEMFGESQVDTDIFLRSLDLVGLASRELEMMDPRARQVLEAYAEGVNAYLETHSPSEISLEYAILPLVNSGYEIEPWTPINTMTWAKMMSWDLSGNMRSEIARAVLSAELPVERVEQLYPPFPEDKPVIVPDDQVSSHTPTEVRLPRKAISVLRAAGERAEEVWALTGGGFEGIGSNNWVLGGTFTASGAPLLANDTHLAIQMPSIWFENGLHCVDGSGDCPYQLVGFSFAGTPGVVIGHNEHIAWGVTTEAADTQDLFIERVNPADPGQYEVDGEWVDFDVRTETIVVAGGDDVVFEARSTRHGPVISGTFLDEDELDDATAIQIPDEYVVAFSWQTLEPSTLVEAVLQLNLANDYAEFRDAMSKWDIAAQNVVYADVDGNIAYQSTGEIPTRARGDGRYPVPGWTSEYEWTGVVPFDDLPAMFNPPRGYIVTANQMVQRPGTLPFIGADSAFGYRGGRIEQMILGGTDQTVTDMQEMQMDARDDGAANLVPFLLDVADVNEARVIEVQARLDNWSRGSEAFQATGSSTGAAIYQATWRHLLINTFQDELPEDHWPSGGSRWFEVVRNLLDTPDDPWWDDVTTEAVETRDDILFRSMVNAYDEVESLLGADVDGWSWGRLHIAHFENQTLGQSGIGPIEWLFNRTAPAEVGGSASIVRAVGWATDLSYEVDWVPSQRMVIDLADLDDSTFIHTTGQSGHAFHANYDDMIEPWTNGTHGPMYWDRDSVVAAAAATLTMVPPD